MATFLKPPSDEGVIRTASHTLPPHPQVGRYVLLAAILGSSMAFLDGSVVNVALPLLQADLHATTADVQWVMELYLLFLAAFLLLGGILGDHYGRRRLYVIGITLFMLASVCCGFAPDLAVLLLSRAVQGVGGAPLVPASLAIISGTFHDQQREQAITAIGLALFAVPTIGGVYWVTFFPAVLVLGLGMALNTAPMTTMVMGSVEQRHAGIASAINNAVARVGSLLAIAVLGIVLTLVFKSSLDAHLAHLSLSPGVRYLVDGQRAKLAGIQFPAGTNNQVQASLRLAVDEAFVSGFRLVALMCAGLALAGALCGWVMIEEKPFGRASRTLAGEAAVQENVVSVSAAHGDIPASPG